MVTGDVTIGGQLFLSSLTPGRIPYITTLGQLTDDSALLWDGTANTLTAGFVRVFNVTRTIPVVVSDAVDIGAYTFTQGAGNIEVWVTVPSAGYAQCKRYFLPAAYNQTNNVWFKCNAVSSTGPYSSTEDVDLEINVNNFVTSFRLRRRLGTVAGQALVTLMVQGTVADAFTPSTAVTTVAAPTVSYLATADCLMGDRLAVGLGFPVAGSGLVANVARAHIGRVPDTVESYSLNNWNATGEQIAAFFSAVATNGGASPGPSVPVLTLHRRGVDFVTYANYADLKLRRYEHSGSTSRTALDFSLTHGDADAVGTDILSLLSGGRVGIRTLLPTASLHLPAGTTAASSAPLKLASGTLMTTPETGAMEFDGANFWLTRGASRTIVAAGAYTHPNHSGDVTSVADGAQTIANDAVTYAKMQNVSAISRLLGRGAAAGAGDPEEIILGTNLSMSGTTLNAAGGGSGNSVTTTLAFGASFTDKAQTVVTGQAWVTATSEIVAQVRTPTGVDPDEMRLLDFKPVISNLVVGTGFTVSLYSDAEAVGDYDVMCVAV